MKPAFSFSLLKRSVLFFGFLISAVSSPSSHAEGPTLKDQFFIQEAIPSKKKQACEKLVSNFNGQQFDKFTSNGSRFIGVDLHGKIWEVKKNTGGVCKLENIARIGIASNQLNSTGEFEEVVFYYEPDSICAYRQSVSDLRRIRRVCYQPIGIVNKYAPYSSP